MNDNKREFQNTYPAYRVRNLPSQPAEKLVSSEIQESARPFNPLLAEKIYPVRKNLFVRINWWPFDTFVVIILMLIGALFIFPGGWTDSSTPEQMAASNAMAQSGLLICVVAPLEYFLLRWYAGRGAGIIGMIGATVALFGLCNFIGSFGYDLVDNASSVPKTILWGLVIFGIVTFICGTMMRLYSTNVHRRWHPRWS